MAKPAKVQKLGAGKRIRMALVAKGGFGKTVFAGTAPHALFLTTDPEGTVSAFEFGSDAEEYKVVSWKDLNDAYRWLRDEGIVAEGYEWVVIDNITEAQAFAMTESLEIAVGKNANRDPFVPDKYEYQRSQNATIDMVKKFNDLPCNIIYTAHRKGMEDGDGQEYYSAAIQGQQGAVAEQILGYMNIIAFGEVVEKDGVEHRRYYFSHHKAYRGKDRFNSIGKFRDDLTVPKMMALVEKSKGFAPAAPVAGTRRVAAKKASPAARRATTRRAS